MRQSKTIETDVLQGFCLLPLFWRNAGSLDLREKTDWDAGTLWGGIQLLDDEAGQCFFSGDKKFWQGGRF